MKQILSTTLIGGPASQPFCSRVIYAVTPVLSYSDEEACKVDKKVCLTTSHQLRFKDGSRHLGWGPELSTRKEQGRGRRVLDLIGLLLW